MRHWLLTLAIAAILVAKNATAGEGASAEALFQEGRTAAKAGNFALACQKFSESQKLDPAPGTLLNLAHCQAELGHLARAWEHYQSVLDQIAPDDDRVAHVREQLAALDPRLPRLTILVSGEADGVVIERDGVQLGAAAVGVALPVDAGSHEIFVRAPGREPRSYRIELAEGDRQSLTVELGPTRLRADAPRREASAIKKPPLPKPDKPAKASSNLYWGYAAGGIGVIGLAVGTTTGILAFREKRIVREHCDSDYACDDTGLDAARAGDKLALASTIGFAVGVVGIGAGTYLILTSRGPVATGRF